MRKIDTLPDCCDCKLEHHSIFSSLTIEELERLKMGKNCNNYKKGSFIFHEGNHMSRFYCINSGIVKMYKTGMDGKEQIVSFAQPGDIIGYRSILSHEPACTTARCIEDVTVCAIPGKSLFEVLGQNSNFSIDLMQLACKELNEANQFLTDIAQKSVREKLAEVLVKLYENFGNNENDYLRIVLTREELGSLAAMATESVIRLLADFKADGFVEIKGRHIKILAEDKLRSISNYF